MYIHVVLYLNILFNTHSLAESHMFFEMFYCCVCYNNPRMHNYQKYMWEFNLHVYVTKIIF